MPRKQAAARKDPQPQAQPAPTPTPARRHVAPVRSRRLDVNASEQKVGQDRPRHMKSIGPARKSLEPAHIEPVENAVTKEFLDELAFMEEKVTVLVHDTTNPADVPVPEVWNDGRVQRFIRGKEQVVKRKFVELLARSKRTTYTQEKVRDDQDIESYRNVPHTVLQFPFSIVHDSNPKGAAWLKNVLAQA